MVTNLVNNKKYIGLTTHTFNIRYGTSGQGAERMFKYYSYKGNSMNEHLYNSMKKHGTENFKVEIIDCSDDVEELKEKEKFWIKFYNSRDDRYGYNISEGGDLSGGITWRFEHYKKNTILKYYDTTLFEKLIDEDYGNVKLCEELFKTDMVIIKHSTEKGKIIKKYYYYKSIYECFNKLNYEQTIHDIFVMCKRSEQYKAEWTKLKYLDKPQGNTKYYFTKDIMLPKDVLFENTGEGAKIKNAKLRDEAREKRQKEIQRKKMQKYMKQTHTKYCAECGKQIKGCTYCADCKAKRECEKQKQKAIQQGRKIKICPICGKEHWRTDIETCGNTQCRRKFKAKN
jgi:hypothetical protein